MDAGGNFVEGSLGMLGDKEKTRIGIDFERIFAETKETENRRRHWKEGRGRF